MARFGLFCVLAALSSASASTTQDALLTREATLRAPLPPRWAAPALVLPTDPSLWYSPFHWLVTPSSATTVNTGSIVRTLFSGSFVNLTFNVSLMVDPPSQVREACGVRRHART